MLRKAKLIICIIFCISLLGNTIIVSANDYNSTTTTTKSKCVENYYLLERFYPFNGKVMKEKTYTKKYKNTTMKIVVPERKWTYTASNATVYASCQIYENTQTKVTRNMAGQILKTETKTWYSPKNAKFN